MDSTGLFMSFWSKSGRLKYVKRYWKKGGGVLQLEEPCSSVSIVSDYGLDDREMEVRSPAGARGFFL
jgi:hypothetical protein